MRRKQIDNLRLQILDLTSNWKKEKRNKLFDLINNLSVLYKANGYELAQRYNEYQNNKR